MISTETSRASEPAGCVRSSDAGETEELTSISPIKTLVCILRIHGGAWALGYSGALRVYCIYTYTKLR